VTRAIRITAQVTPGGVHSYSRWRGAVVSAEGAGADIIFGHDHFHRSAVEKTTDGWCWRPNNPTSTNFEGWTALASWAEVSRHAEIGLLVSAIGFRNLDLLADMARTVDHVSSGRLILGIGAGWYEKDYTAYGYDFGTTKSRLDLFDEGVARIERRLANLTPLQLRQFRCSSRFGREAQPADGGPARRYLAQLPVADRRVPAQAQAG
jgi:alkanesulfonate monooxygenase SsuD/methylene tetrahydromethanopterin reductase-like flavin-dependent oxidoreductase (luciferase family)